MFALGWFSFGQVVVATMVGVCLGRAIKFLGCWGAKQIGWK